MASKTVLILGGGIGGIVAARRLRSKLSSEHRVVLVDRSANYAFAPSFPWLVMGWRSPQQISRPLASLRKKGIEVITGEVARIDLAGRIVAVDSKEVPYDHLIVSLGAELAPAAVPGLPEAAHTFYDLQGAESLRKALEGFGSGNVAIVIAKLPFTCPAAPYEGAFLLDYLFRKKGTRSNIDIQVFTPETLPMPVAGPAIGGLLKGMLEGRAIGFNPGAVLSSVDASERTMVFEDGRTAQFDLLIAVPPHESPRVVRESGLAAESGWVPVHPRTLATQHEGVFALGDVTAIKLPSGLMLPKAGVFAHGQAKVVADNIAAEIGGKRNEGWFDGDGSCFIETGYGKAAYGSGNFYAEPTPAVKLHEPGRRWHWGRRLFEWSWLRRWF